jgi:hypothetical protein
MVKQPEIDQIGSMFRQNHESIRQAGVTSSNATKRLRPSTWSQRSISAVRTSMFQIKTPFSNVRSSTADLERSPFRLRTYTLVGLVIALLPSWMPDV